MANQKMTPFNPNPYEKQRASSTDLLIKGIVCSLIGLGILVGPYFMAAGGMRDMVAGAWLVGWFALGLGVVFGVRFVTQRGKRQQP